MDLKVNNYLHSLNYNPATPQSGKIELFDVRTLQLDRNESISFKEMEILPIDYKNDLRKVFLSAINKNGVQKEIKEKNATSISLKIINDKLVYKLDGSKDYKTLNDEKVQKAFKRTARNIKKYLKNVGTLKEKEFNISTVDENIIKSGPSDIEKVSNKIFKKIKKSNTEWSLWTIWACELRGAFQKTSNFLGIDINWRILPKGMDDALGYMFGSLGILSGIKLERNSRKIEDTEGQRDGRHKITRNVIAMIGGTIDCIAKTLAITGKTLAKVILSGFASVIFIFVTIYATLRYLYFNLKALAFKYKFSKYTENNKLNEQQKIMSSLKFLKNKITVTKKEAVNIIKKIRKQNPTFSDYKIKKVAHEQIAKKLLTKIKRFERRVGPKIANMMQKDIDEILKNPTNLKNIEKAHEILKKVKTRNDLMVHENKWYAIASLLQGLEIILFIVFGYITLAALIGGISSTIVLIMLGAYFYRKHIKVEGKEDKSMLDENLDLIIDPSK